MRLFLAFLILVAAQFFLRPSPLRGSASLERRFPGAVSTVLIGGFRPFLVQYLWWHVERAYEEGDYFATLRDLQLLSEVDEDSPRAAGYMAHLLAYNLAPRERSPRARFDRIEEALVILERTERRHPRNAELPFRRAQLLTAPWAFEPGMARLHVRRRRTTPLGAAVLAYERAAELDPGAWTTRMSLAECSRYRGIEILLNDRDMTGALAALRRAQRVLTETPQASGVLGILAAGWVSVASGLETKDAHAIEAGLSHLARAFAELPEPEGPGGGVEERLAIAILKPLSEFGKESAKSSPPSDALSLVLALHSIRALLDKRLTSAGGETSIAPAFGSDIREALASILQRAPALRDRIPKGLLPKAP